MDSSNNSLSPAIELSRVHVLFGEACALDIDELYVQTAERVFLLGRSGSGKTTFSRLIKGRLRPSTGKVRVFGRDPAQNLGNGAEGFARRVALIDQEFYLIPRLCVIDNVLTGALGRVSAWKSLLGWYPEAELEKAASILREVDLERLADRRVETLSGGQRQRTAIARALMQEADIILADEPVSNLDPELAEDALDLLIECVGRRGVTLLVNLHQPSLARKFASRIVGLADGRVVYDGPPDAFGDRAADFLYQAPGKDKVVSIDSRRRLPSKPA